MASAEERQRAEHALKTNRTLRDQLQAVADGGACKPITIPELAKLAADACQRYEDALLKLYPMLRRTLPKNPPSSSAVN